MEIRTLIREGIDGRGMSQAGFARAVGVAPPLVSRWLNDAEPVVPSPANCQRIADVLGLDRRTVLAAAGHYEEGPGEEMPADPRWELEQRKLRDIYAGVEEEKWSVLTEAVRLVRSLSAPPPDDSPRPTPVRSAVRGPKWLEDARLRRLGQHYPEANDDGEGVAFSIRGAMLGVTDSYSQPETPVSEPLAV